MFRGEEGKEDIEVMEENIWSDLVGEKKLSCVIHVTMLRMSDSVLDPYFFGIPVQDIFSHQNGTFSSYIQCFFF